MRNYLKSINDQKMIISYMLMRQSLIFHPKLIALANILIDT